MARPKTESERLRDAVCDALASVQEDVRNAGSSGALEGAALRLKNAAYLVDMLARQARSAEAYEKAHTT